MDDILNKLKALIREKGVENIVPEDMLAPEMKWIIELAPLTEEDRRLAELIYVKKVRPCEAIDKMQWGSAHTYYRHKKIVWKHVQTVLRRISD